MSYNPPTGTVALSLRAIYVPPVGTANLSLGAGGPDDRLLTLAGETRAPSGNLWIGVPGLVVLSGETLAPMGAVVISYDANLLSSVVTAAGNGWQAGETLPVGPLSLWQAGALVLGGGPSLWQPATLLPDATVAPWQDAERIDRGAAAAWQVAAALNDSRQPHWQQAHRIDRDSADTWQEADAVRQGVVQDWRDLPLLPRSAESRWQEGRRETQHIRERFSDGVTLSLVSIEVWQQAGYPGNAANPGPAIPQPLPTPWGTRLRLVCPLPGTRLRIARTPCILIADREVAIRRTYMSINSASLVRWPDLTPLPVTNLTLETDFDSWCWALSATLAGPDAWALVQPNPLACEVLATINGQQWKCLLDVPSTQRSFGNDRVSLRGRSCSAWLHDPYTPARNGDQAEARTMQQLGVLALTHNGIEVGWTLDWQLENWVVPAGRYFSQNTPIGALMRLVQVTGDGLYTDPVLPILEAVKRWPVASWLVDGETADLAIPEAAVISLSQSPVYSQPLNGVYVSGISHGALALVKIAGTDGALQPNEPITHELLCDEAGFAARQRGLNALSDAGAGFTMDAETLFTPEVGLVRPGLIVSIAGMRGVSRSVKISASWGGDGLSVRQSIGLERREVEGA
jgi:hypothetical protein